MFEANTGTKTKSRMRRPEFIRQLDVHIGQRIRLRRGLVGLTQDKLAQALGLTFQQVQKYEKGANRVSASTLYHLAEILNVPVTFFYDDFGQLPGTDDVAQISTSESRFLGKVRGANPDVTKAIYALVDVLSEETPA